MPMPVKRPLKQTRRDIQVRINYLPRRAYMIVIYLRPLNQSMVLSGGNSFGKQTPTNGIQQLFKCWHTFSMCLCAEVNIELLGNVVPYDGLKCIQFS